MEIASAYNPIIEPFAYKGDISGIKVGEPYIKDGIVRGIVIYIDLGDVKAGIENGLFTCRDRKPDNCEICEPSKGRADIIEGLGGPNCKASLVIKKENTNFSNRH